MAETAVRGRSDDELHGESWRHRDGTARYVHFVYVARCADGTLYVGNTSDPEERLRRHNDGEGGRYTKWRRPVALILVESFETLEGAIRRERQIKRWSKKKKLALAEGDVEKLRALAKRRKRSM